MENNNLQPKTVLVSGGFDPIHIGHVRMIQDAKKLGDKLIVAINNDNWLKKKKGFVFMPQTERKEVIEAIYGVDEVIFTDHEPDPQDMSICSVLRKIRPHIFANGGDQTKHTIPEIPVCEEIGCEMIFNVGWGGKVQSSSFLAGQFNKSLNEHELKCSNPQDYRNSGEVKKFGIYEHYKGNRYQVVGLVKNSETQEEMVVYQALYGNRQLWTRPLWMFLEKVEVDNQKMPRFRYIGE